MMIWPSSLCTSKKESMIDAVGRKQGEGLADLVAGGESVDDDGHQLLTTGSDVEQEIGIGPARGPGRTVGPIVGGLLHGLGVRPGAGRVTRRRFR